MKLTESVVWMQRNGDLLFGFGVRMEVKFPREENLRRQRWHQRLHPLNDASQDGTCIQSSVQQSVSMLRIASFLSCKNQIELMMIAG